MLQLLRQNSPNAAWAFLKNSYNKPCPMKGFTVDDLVAMQSGCNQGRYLLSPRTEELSSVVLCSKESTSSACLTCPSATVAGIVHCLVLFIVYLAGGRATGTQTLHQVTASPDTSLRTHGARRLAARPWKLEALTQAMTICGLT